MDIQSFENTMTVFFSKSTGKIKALCQGSQNFDFFGEDKADMELILDKLEIPFNHKVMSNMDFYMVKDNQITVNQAMLEHFSI